MRRLASSILSAEELQLLQAHADAKDARARRDARIEKRRAGPRRKAYAAAIRKRRNFERAEAVELRRRDPGPNLPRFCFQNSATRVVLQDLEAVPRTWLQEHRAELELRGRAEDLPAVAIAVLELILWAAELRTDTANGCGLQVTPAALAELLESAGGRSNIRKCLGLLELRGYVAHYRQTRRFRNITQRLGIPEAQWTAPDGESRPLTRWRSGDGKLRHFIDLVGVVYVTREGRRAARRVVRVTQGPRKGLPFPYAARAALRTSLRKAARHARARFALAPALRVPPYAVEPVDESILLRCRPPPSGETGPPDD